MKKLLTLVFSFLTLPLISSAQNVAYHDIALQNVSGFAKIIPSAVITVCSGLHTEVPCNPTTPIFSTAAGAGQANPFNADLNGNFSFYATPGANYTISITGFGVIGYNLPFFAPLVSVGIIGNINVSSVTSTTPNPAVAGFIRMACNDTINWRNNANSGDDILSDTCPVNGNIPADSLKYAGSGFVGNFFASNNTGISLSGFLRLSTNDSIAWRNNAGNADIVIAKTIASGNLPGDTIAIGGGNQGLFANFFADGTGGTSALAGSGVARLNSASTLCWRNNANSGDLCLSKNASDFFLFNGINVTRTTSIGTPGHLVVFAANGFDVSDGGAIPNGLPGVVYNTASASTNVSIGTTTMSTASGGGNTYRFSYYEDISVTGVLCAGASLNTVLTLTYTDPNAGSSTTETWTTNTFNTQTAGSPLPFASTTPTNPFYTFRAKAATAVQYAVAYNTPTPCATTNPSIQVYPVLEIVQ
jgi:hypothetical protein